MTDLGPGAGRVETQPVETQPVETQPVETQPVETVVAPEVVVPDTSAPGDVERAPFDPFADPRPRAASADEGGAAGSPDAPTYPPEVWRIVAVAGVAMELPNANPEVILHEAQDPWREVRIPVGLAEGTAIAYAYRSIDTPRPLTHALFAEILERHDVTIEAVRITVRRGQVFFAEVDTSSPRGRKVVPCRPSDAIALALRQRMPTPVLVADWVFTGAAAPPGVGADGTVAPTAPPV